MLETFDKEVDGILMEFETYLDDPEYQEFEGFNRFEKKWDEILGCFDEISDIVSRMDSSPEEMSVSDVINDIILQMSHISDKKDSCFKILKSAQEEDNHSAFMLSNRFSIAMKFLEHAIFSLKDMYEIMI